MSTLVRLIAAMLVVVTLYALPNRYRINHVKSQVDNELLHVDSSAKPIHDSGQKVNRRDTESLCTSATCLDFSKSMKSSLASNHTTIDPCEDFSTYACEGWRQTHNIARGDDYIDMFSLMTDINDSILRNILDGEFTNKTAYSHIDQMTAQDNFNKVKTAYLSCLDKAAIKKAGVAPLRALLDELDTYYPAAQPNTAGNGSRSSNQELTELLLWLAKRTIPNLINTAVVADSKNTQASIFIVDVDHGIPGSYYRNDTIMHNYTNTIAQMFNIVWADNQTISLNNSAVKYVDTAKKVIKLEGELTRASNRNTSDTLSTLAELDAIIPEISITSFLNTLKPAGYDIKTLDGNINYLRRLSGILKSTPREVLHAYFQTSVIRTWAPRLDEAYNRPLHEFRNVTGDEVYLPPTGRGKVCLAEVQDNLDWLLGSVFIDRVFSPKSKLLGDDIVKSIIEVYSSRLESLDWMTNSTKLTAKKKLASIVSKLGYPTDNPNLINATDVQSYYRNVTITKDYFKNTVNYAQSQTKNLWDTLLTGDLWDLSRMKVPVATAFYSRVGHTIVIPAGIMQLPIFHPELPEYVSYGGLGSIIGHELSHGIDAGASETDSNGTTTRWWDNATTTHYETKARCFVRQYANFTFLDEKEKLHHVNGEATQEENIADAGGISASYTAWKKRAMARPNQKLPGLEEFTADQLFFLSYASTWCAVVKPEEVAMQSLFDVHSPRDKRILGTLANSRDFREAFGCKVREPTCELW